MQKTAGLIYNVFVLMDPAASVIILNYNGKEVIGDCLASVSRQVFRDYEVIVVDNGSTDGSDRIVREILDGPVFSGRATFVPLKKNLGFPGGNAEGLKKARGTYIVLLNNDTEPDPLWLKELVLAAQTHPAAGIVASKLVDWKTGRIDSAGDGYTTTLKGFKRGEGEVDRGQYDRMAFVFGACAGAVLYKREVLDRIGFLDEDFFLIHEDTDLNFRAHLAGWKVLYTPTALVRHKVRSTIGAMSEKAVYYTLRNSELMRLKNIPLPVFLLYLPEFLIGTVTEFIYFALKHGHLKLYFRAKVDALRMAPRMLKKRKEITKIRKATNRQIAAIMTPLWEGSVLKGKVKKLIHD